MEENKNRNENVHGNMSEEEIKRKANEIVDKIKELVKKGNVTHVRIRKDDTIILNLPMNVGVVSTALGVAFAPWALIISTISLIGFKCTVEVQNKDGSITVIYGKEN